MISKIKNKLKIKDEQLKYDFLPSMLEITERPPEKLSTVLFIAVVLCMISILVWSKLTKLDIAVSAPCNVASDKGVFTLTAKKAGVVESVGWNPDEDTYGEGTVLVTLKSESAEPEIAELQYQKEILEIQDRVYTKLYEAV
nr:hypothetical protein [Lachnospiraceae bacterium]